MKTMITTFWQSISDPAIYRQLANRSFKQAFGYFAFWYAAFALMGALLATIFVVPKARDFSKSMLMDVRQGFPQDVSVTIQDNRLSIDGAEAISIPFSNDQGLRYDNIVVIDPSKDAEDISDLSTLLLMTDEAFSLPNATLESGYQVFRWEQLATDLTISADTVNTETTSLMADIDRLYPWVFPVLATIMFVAMISGRLVMVVFNSIFVNLIMIVTGRGQSYMQSLVIGLHTIVVAEVINVIQLLVYAGAFPRLITYAFLGISTIAVLALPKRPARRE